MDVDDFASIAGDAARMIYGERARIVLEEVALLCPPRYVARVKYRGESVPVDSCPGNTPSDALRGLASRLVGRVRQTQTLHDDVRQRAVMLGL